MMQSDFEPPAKLTPRLIVDKREKTPLVFTRFPSSVGLLSTGDYSIAGAERYFSVERKSVKDLLDCSTGREKDRFERVMQRMRGFSFCRLLIIGSETTVVERRNAWHFLLDAEVRFSVPVVWARTPAEAARLVERWAYWWTRVAVGVARDTIKAGAQNGDGNAANRIEVLTANDKERVAA